MTDRWQHEIPICASGDDVAVTATQTNARYPHLYVVMRVDDFQAPSPPEDRIALVAAFHSAEAADQDAARLNELSADHQVRYLVHLTQLKD